MNRPRTALALGAMAWLVCTVAPLARATDSGVSRVTLANGLRVVLAPDSAATAADVAVWYATGARSEKPGLSGMTRLFERLMFRGSAGVPDGEHRRRIHAQGGLANTTTTADYSCFWQTVPGEAVGLALQLEADRMAGLRPSAAALGEERRALVGDRRAAAQRAPIARGLAALYATVFAGQSYGRPLLGAEGDLDRVTLRDIDAWRKERYLPTNAVLTIVGRFEPVATLQRVRQAFGSLPKGAVLQSARMAAPSAPRRRFELSDSPARLLFV
ncbi:MAG: pitrilysin family protein, partial [Candidatus Eisenbacteria bacterium]